MVDNGFIIKLETQALEFPNSDHDDVLDTLSQMIEVFRSKGNADKQTPNRQMKPKINRLT